jgi:transcriptional regulator with XRE-family HTH domain
MGQASKPLTPARSVLDYVGAQVRHLRIGRGMSQAEVGARLFIHRDLVCKIEKAERIPSREFIERCDELFVAGGSLTRLLPLIERERLLRSDPDRGTRTTCFRRGINDRAVLDWLLSMPSSDPDPAGDDSVIEAARRLEQLRRRDHTHGAGATYPAVEETLRNCLPTLVQTAPHIAAGMLELAGYDAVDLGNDGLAQQHYLHALDLTIRSENRLYGGYIVAVSLGHLALHCGDPDQAVRLATAGIHGTKGHATPSVRAAFGSVLARGYARRGDRASCLATLVQVEADLARSRPGEEPRWISYFGEADLADEKAHCFFDLGMTDLARSESDVALRMIPSNRLRRITIDTALQAAIQARAGEVERACAVARSAIDYAVELASLRVAQRIVLMLGELQPYGDVREVREVNDYARASRQPVVRMA